MPTQHKLGAAVPLALAALFLTLPLASDLSAGETLTLRLNNVEAVPGGIAALVLRTYAPRPIGQGQVCFTGRQIIDGVPAGPVIDGIVGAVVFSRNGDAQRRTRFEDMGGLKALVLEFFSPSGSINEVDGPLAAIGLRLSPDLVPGSSYLIELDPVNTFLLDDTGAPVLLELRSAELTVRDPVAPHTAAAEAEKTRPGGLARLSFQTTERVLLSAGQVVLYYDPAIATGQPKVRMDARYGGSEYLADTSVPGRVEVSFTSPQADLNRIPGDLVEIAVPTRADIPVGTRVPITLDRDLTWLVDAAGQPMDLLLEDGELVFD